MQLAQLRHRLTEDGVIETLRDVYDHYFFLTGESYIKSPVNKAEAFLTAESRKLVEMSDLDKMKEEFWRLTEDGIRETLFENMQKVHDTFNHFSESEMSDFERIVQQIKEEREYQAKWGNNFDDKNTANDWATYIAQYLTEGTRIKDPRPMREAFLKAAALAVAALETFDRNNGFAPRHYDKQS